MEKYLVAATELKKYQTSNQEGERNKTVQVKRPI